MALAKKHKTKDRPMIQLRTSAERGQARHGWLESYHSFSFADYYDPANTHFRALRVINEDWIAPGMGFCMHPHRDMEILTYVVEGALEHRDSMGHRAVMRAGDVQRISAGTGIEHSEVNASAEERVHLLQIWIVPDRRGATPRYDEQSFHDVARGRLHLVASKEGRDGSLPIHQDADLLLGKLEGGGAVRHELRPGRHAWLQLVRGTLTVNGTELAPGDALAASRESALAITASQPADFLLFDLN